MDLLDGPGTLGSPHRGVSRILRAPLDLFSPLACLPIFFSFPFLFLFFFFFFFFYLTILVTVRGRADTADRGTLSRWAGVVPRF